MGTNNAKWIGIGAAILALACGFWVLLKPGAGENSHAIENHDEVVEDLVAGEEWMELMGGELNGWAKTMEAIPVTDAPAGAVAGQVAKSRAADGPAGLNVMDFAFEESPGRVPAGLWDFAELTGVKEGKFGFLRGSFTNRQRDGFTGRVIFSAKGKAPDGGVTGFDTEQEITWQMKEGGQVPSKQNDYLIEPTEWEITGWKMLKARTVGVGEPLFREVTGELIPDSDDMAKIEKTGHAAHLETLFSGGEIQLKKGYGRYFTTDATAQHPGLSVVDINGDGRDDLYVCVRWGRNLLFRDRGDGTFEEAAAEYGLDLDGLSACAIFADFDNDGDPDVVVGRSLERSLYLRNEGGVFLDASDTHVAAPLPFLTTSLAAADYNGDGLLDIYLSTYGFAIRQPREQVASDFLTDYSAREVADRFVSPPDVEPYLNLPGPPNVLLVNRGDGRFEISPLSKDVATWHETLQATWADYDQDGDPDLYVCNDFAPDVLFRNDGDRFTDVTGEDGHERMRGFGMGASFGDFDNDSDPDLYVSNMFSKAGLRIIDRVGLEDERFRWSAEGNLLFSNNGSGRFAHASTADSPLATVARADWSWGGQFCDFDSDGFLDLYVPNGYFTAPEAYAGEVDL